VLESSRILDCDFFLQLSIFDNCSK